MISMVTCDLLDDLFWSTQAEVSPDVEITLWLDGGYVQKKKTHRLEPPVVFSHGALGRKSTSVSTTKLIMWLNIPFESIKCNQRWLLRIINPLIESLIRRRIAYNPAKRDL